MKNLKFILGAGIAVLLGTNIVQCDRNNKASDTLAMYEAIQDSLVQIYNKLGQQETSISSLVATSSSALMRVNSNDTLINELKSLVRNSRGSTSATVHTVETSFRDTGSVQIIRDTLTNEITFPIVVTGGDAYFSGFVYAWEDRSNWNISFRDTFGYKVESAPSGFLNLGPKTHKITAINYNPHSRTTGLRNFTLKERRKKFHIGLNIGYGIWANKSNIKLGWHAGFGLHYSLLSF